MPVRPEIIIKPNPVNKHLTISFEIIEGTKPVSISIYNEQGQILETLLSERIYTEGTHILDAKIDLPAGMYFVLVKINKNLYFDKIIITN